MYPSHVDEKNHSIFLSFFPSFIPFNYYIPVLCLQPSDWEQNNPLAPPQTNEELWRTSRQVFVFLMKFVNSYPPQFLLSTFWAHLKIVV